MNEQYVLYVQIPEEKYFKGYTSNDLDVVLERFDRKCKLLPNAIIDLFDRNTQQIIRTNKE